MPPNQVKPQKGSDIVREHLKREISSGHYPPGSRLPTVVSLADSFEVGRSTIREALSGLKAMGWIEIRHGGGTFVSKELPAEEPPEPELIDSAESLQEVLEVRRFVETGSVTLAASRRTEEDLARLEDILAHMERVLGDEEESERADVGFHRQIAAASHNKLLIQLMETLTGRLHESMKESRRLWFFAERSSAERLLEEHRMIYEAIRDGDGEAAAARMASHLRKADSVLRWNR
ncbi:FadR family transcriptional regulator [Paenibacillus sp. CC-CFT747]|nr:FadR family transcriptional regulator [Paenibacillus sp. CC-CFT747]